MQDPKLTGDVSPSLIWTAADMLLDVADTRSRAVVSVTALGEFVGAISEFHALLHREASPVQAELLAQVSTLAGLALAGDVGASGAEFGRLEKMGAMDDV